jgi:hypothetical protein
MRKDTAILTIEYEALYVTRILHGLCSSKVPLAEWNHNTLWGSCKHIDFQQLMWFVIHEIQRIHTTRTAATFDT